MGRKKRRSKDDVWTPDAESEGEAENQKEKKGAQKTKRKSKRTKKDQEANGEVNEDLAALYFRAMDTEKTGTLTLSHIQKMIESLDVDVLEDQIQDMMTYAHDTTQSAQGLDLEAFCKLVV